MKKLYLLGIGLIVAGTVLTTACESEPEGAVAISDYTAVAKGMDLKVEWSEVEGADGYLVYVDNTVIDTIDDPATTEYIIPASKAGKVVKVALMDGTGGDEIDLTPVATASLDVWSTADPDPNHPSGINFAQDGKASAVSVANSPNLVDLFVDGSSATTLALNSPDVGNYNSEKNYLADWTSGKVADTAWTYYNYTEYLAMGDAFGVWMGSGDGWDTNDHFVKVKVNTIDGLKVNVSTLYQLQGGLRWLPE